MWPRRSSLSTTTPLDQVDGLMMEIGSEANLNVADLFARAGQPLSATALGATAAPTTAAPRSECVRLSASCLFMLCLLQLPSRWVPLLLRLPLLPCPHPPSPRPQLASVVVAPVARRMAVAGVVADCPLLTPRVTWQPGWQP